MKKITLTLLALVCALCCALGLAACGDDTPKVNGILIVPSGEQPDVTKQHDQVYTEITYGETPDLSFYKLYLYYGNGDTKELALNDEKLTVVYSYSGFNSTESKTMEKLPEEWIAGNYSIAYTYDSKSDSQYKATALINVNWAQSGAFSVQPTKLTWSEGEKSPNVILKTPKGLTVTDVESINAVEKSDDSDGCYYLRYVEKQVYDAFTEAQKTDYEFLESCSNVHTYVADIEGYSVGEYMLFAMIDRTYNYDSVVTPAVKITVNAPAPTTEVTAAEWAEILTSAQSSLNFTMTLKDKDVNYDAPNSDGDIQFPMTIEIDELKGHYIDGMTLNVKTEAVYVKDGENYYDYEGKDNVWTRKSVSSSEYQSQYESFQSMARMLTLLFANDFASFRYESGKYVCDALNKPDMQASFVNIEITFENGAVKRVTLEQEGEYGGIYEIHFGTTTITLPTNYTEIN